MKKETIEEVAKRIYPINIVSDGYDTNMLCRTGFYIGYELGQERSYSEEDMREAFNNGAWRWRMHSKVDIFKEWLEQFKK